MKNGEERGGDDRLLKNEKRRKKREGKKSGLPERNYVSYITKIALHHSQFSWPHRNDSRRKKAKSS